MNKLAKSKVLLTALLGASLTAGLMAAPAKGVETINLTIWTFGQVIQPGLQREYQKLHPEIKINPIKNDVDPLHQKTTLSCQTKSGPADIIAFEVPYSGYWRTGNRPSCFQDLREMKTSDTNVASGIAAGLSANDIKSNYLPWRWEQGVAFNDRVIGIPTDVGGLQVAYRTDLFKKAGLPTDRVAVGKLWPTWEKFIQVGKSYVTKLTPAEQKSGKRFIDDAGSIYAAVMNQGTSKYYQADGTDAGKLVYKTNPQIKKAWNTTVAALDAGIGARLGQFSTDWNVGMSKGAMATILAPAWMLDYIKQQAPDTKGKWDIADLPVGGGNQGGTELTIPAYSKNKQAAYDFLNWYLAPAQQLKVFKTYGLFPSTSVLYDDAALLDYKDPFFNNAPVGQIYTKGVLKLKPIFEGELQRAIDQKFGSGLGRVATKKETSLKSYANVISDIDKLLKN
jgi:cellobiose transport system substrate-binding protein